MGVLACRSTTCDESFISVTIRNRCDALGAHMPTTCRTPGQGGINIEKGDKILVLDEAKLAKLIEKHRRALMAMPGPDDEPPNDLQSAVEFTDVIHFVAGREASLCSRSLRRQRDKDDHCSRK